MSIREFSEIRRLFEVMRHFLRVYKRTANSSNLYTSNSCTQAVGKEGLRVARGSVAATPVRPTRPHILLQNYLTRERYDAPQSVKE